MTPGDAFKHGNALQWTLARISTLSVQEVR